MYGRNDMRRQPPTRRRGSNGLAQFWEYGELLRRHYGPGKMTARKMLVLVALMGIGFSLAFNYPIQSLMTDNRIIAIVYTLGMAFSAPACVTFWLPWSPGAMLLMRINFKTPGQIMVGVLALYFLGYAAITHWAYWMTQPIYTISPRYALMQVITGIIITIVIPGLAWAPVLVEEITETAHQKHLVDQYILFTESEIAIQRAQLLQAQELATKSWAELLPEEKAQFAQIGAKLARGVRKTLDSVGASMLRVNKVYQAFPMDEEAEYASRVLETYSTNLGFPMLEDEEDERDPYERDQHIQRYTTKREREGSRQTGRLVGDGREDQRRALADRAWREERGRARDEDERAYTRETRTDMRNPNARRERRDRY